MPKTPPPPLSDSEALHQILYHMERMDRRDRIRMTGSTIRGLIGLISIGFFLVSMWYVYANVDEFIKKITTEAAKQAAAATQQQSEGMIESLQKLIPKR